MRHPKPPVSAWIIAERKRLGWKVEELSRRLVDMGYAAEIGTVRVWESGRTPAAETIAALERLFDSPAPRETESFDGELAAAIRAQTEAMQAMAAAITVMAEEMREQREATQGRVEGMAAALGDLASTLESLKPALAGKSR